MRQLLLLLLLSLFVVTLSNCRKKSKKERWEVEVLTPIMKGDVNFQSMVGDSLLQEDGDEGLRLVYQNSLYKLLLAQQGIEIPDTALKQVVTLDSISLGNRSIVYPITLGQVARNDQSGTGGLIIGFHGQNVAIPAIPGTSSMGQEVDATNIFETADLNAGFLDIKIHNGFPVPIDTLIFQLKNKVDGAVLVYDTFPNIPKNATITQSYDMAGNTVEGTMVADIIKLSSPGSGGNPVPIDTNDAITLTVTARDMDIQSATAVFPSQNLIDIKNEVTYNMKGPELTLMKIRSGNLVITAVNTIEDSLHLRYRIPGAKSSSGLPIDVQSVVAPAPPNSSVTLDQTIDLSGYTIDLRGKNNTIFNTFYNEFTARIDSTGKKISISLDDSISVFYGLEDIEPEYVEGYIGSETFQVGPATVPFDLFKNFHEGTLDIEGLDVSFNIYNTIGANGSLTVRELTANNSQGQTEALNAPFINQGLEVKRAHQNPFQPGITTIDLDNTNIESMFELMPHQFGYDLEMVINPDGNKYNYQDFAGYNDYVDISLDLEMPLSFSAKGLKVVDTFDFDLTSLETTAEQVKSGTFYFLVGNMFPIDAGLQLEFLDEQGTKITELFGSFQPIAAGEIDDATCRVHEPTNSRLEAKVDENKMQLVRKAKQVRVVAAFDTVEKPACGPYTKIYSNYNMDFKLTGRFIYGLNEF